MNAQAGNPWGDTAEVSFISGMEREPHPPDESWLVRWVREEVEGIRAKMLNQEERGPSDTPYVELQARINQLERDIDRYNSGGYHEAPKPPKTSTASRMVIINCTVAIVCTSIFSAIGIAVKVAMLETQVSANNVAMLAYQTTTREWQVSMERRFEKLEDRKQ